MADHDRKPRPGDPKADAETAWHGEDRIPPNNPDLEEARRRAEEERQKAEDA